MVALTIEVPANAPMKRTDDNTVRWSDLEVMTPISAEYGTLIAV